MGRSGGLQQRLLQVLLGNRRGGGGARVGLVVGGGVCVGGCWIRENNEKDRVVRVRRRPMVLPPPVSSSPPSRGGPCVPSSSLSPSLPPAPTTDTDTGKVLTCHRVKLFSRTEEPGGGVCMLLQSLAPSRQRRLGTHSRSYRKPARRPFTSESATHSAQAIRYTHRDVGLPWCCCWTTWLLREGARVMVVPRLR